MASTNERDNLAQLYSILMPVLAKAAVGDFSAQIEIDKNNDQRVTELLVGVQVLFDVLNEKIEELEAANARLAASRDRSVTLLDEVLKNSLD